MLSTCVHACTCARVGCICQVVDAYKTSYDVADPVYAGHTLLSSLPSSFRFIVITFVIYCAYVPIHHHTHRYLLCTRSYSSSQPSSLIVNTINNDNHRYLLCAYEVLNPTVYVALNRIHYHFFRFLVYIRGMFHNVAKTQCGCACACVCYYVNVCVWVFFVCVCVLSVCLVCA